MKETIIDTLDFRPGIIQPDAGFYTKSIIKSHFLKKIQQDRFEIDHVYFSGDLPSLYFKQVDVFDENQIRTIAKLQRKIWNQGKVPMLYVESETEIRIYNCYETPVNHEIEIKRIEKALLIASFLRSKKEDIESLSETFDKRSIDSGKFWEYLKYANKIKNEKRVNRALINNFKETREKLLKAGLKDVKYVHNLLLRSLFLLYLEDRGATLPKYYKKYLKDANSYFYILDCHDATYQLYEVLENHFNGDLLPVMPTEKKIVSEKHLKIIKECFWSRLSDSDQLKMFDWRIFDFSIIPIELISEIYEVFLEEYDGQKKKSSDGAYYTPHVLVEFILNRVLPYPSSKDSTYNIKLLDPTCGSGIFLVESLNRLLDRWEFSNQEKSIDFETIKEITLNNIYGIERNEEAIKVAAFSIYLTMLNRLNPRTLWEKKKFPKLIYDNDSGGTNLFTMSSLSKGPFEEIDFQLIVGNPPFKGRAIDDEGKKYLNERQYASEYVLAFLDRAIDLCPNGKIALVATSKILFNTSHGYQRFRKFLFCENYVESIYNFSILRKLGKSLGGSLFASAVGPACVVFYAKEVETKFYKDRVLYCAPRSSRKLLKNKIADALVIDDSDIRYIPRSETTNPSSKIWKVSMWGSERDFNFIQSLSSQKNLGAFLKEQKVNIGVGFQTSLPLKFKDSTIAKLPFLKTSKIERYGTSLDNTLSIHNTNFGRLGKIEAYKAPHIVIKRGQKNRKVCASYISYDCSFTSSVFGINGSKNRDETMLKVLVAYINSAISTYYLFLTTSTWGIEREIVSPNEYLNLPAKILNQTSYPQEFLGLIDKRIELGNNLLDSNTAEKGELERKINSIIYELLDLTSEEITLIEDFLKFNIDMFQRGRSSVAFNPASLSDIENHGKHLVDCLNRFTSKSSTILCQFESFDVPKSFPLNLIILRFKDSEVGIQNISHKENDILKPLEMIDKYTYEKFSESIYFRKNIRYFNNDSIYIVKPNEKRFWTTSMAFTEADKIITEVINSDNNGR